MAKWFRKPNLNPDVKAYASYFGRGLLIIFAILLLAGLVLGSFFYGDRARDESNQPATTEEASPAAPSSEPQPAEPATPATPPDSTETAESQPTSSDGANQPAGSNAAAPTPEATSNTPTGPSSVPVTGAEDWAPWVGSLIVLIIWKYRQSKRLLVETQQR